MLVSVDFYGRSDDAPLGETPFTHAEVAETVVRAVVQPLLRAPRARRQRSGGRLMLARQRQERILELAQTAGAVRVSELVDVLGVSDMTIRRDISVLARKGRLTRVHGGATALSARAADEPGFTAKFQLQKAEKSAIARAAASLVSAGDSVAISGGTTTYAVAVELLALPRLTVVTNSVPVGELLHASGRDDLTVILTGGHRTPSDALVGPIALGALSMLHVDWLFLGVHGVDDRAGLTTPNLVEAETDRALLRCARRTVVVADSSKWHVVGLSSIAGLSEIDVMVTDDRLPPEARRMLESREGTLMIATPDPDPADPARPADPADSEWAGAESQALGPP